LLFPDCARSSAFLFLGPTFPQGMCRNPFLGLPKHVLATVKLTTHLLCSKSSFRHFRMKGVLVTSVVIGSHPVPAAVLARTGRRAIFQPIWPLWACGRPRPRRGGESVESCLAALWAFHVALFNFQNVRLTGAVLLFRMPQDRILAKTAAATEGLRLYRRV